MGLFGKLNPRRNRASTSAQSSSPSSLVSNSTLIPPSTQFDAGPVTLPLGPDLNSPVFIYYYVFRQDGIIPCKDPVDPKNPYLARIDAMHITPPRNVASTMLCMCRTEGTVTAYPQMFASASDKTPMRNDKYLSIGSGPGSHPLKPLALVIRDFASFDTTAVAPSETGDVDPSTFCQAIFATGSWKESLEHQWLSYKKGDILYTDGKKLCVPWRRHALCAYRARTADSRVGFIDISACKFGMG